MMECCWEALVRLLPPWLRTSLDRARDARGQLWELRLRLGQPAEGVFSYGRRDLEGKPVDREDISCIVGRASEHSAYASATVANGFLTAPGGHRIGLCGQAVCKDGQVTGLREITGLCIRVARDYPGTGAAIAGTLTGSALLLGPPGSGKTTLLRDMVRQLARTRGAVAVVDERGELFPKGMDPGRVDVLSGCPKGTGIEMLLRSMGPSWIAVDEITAAADCIALTLAAGCGVQLLATAHGFGKEDLRRRKIYRELLDTGVFRQLVVLRSPGTYHMERIEG